jgi:hypothetical protein
MMIRHTRKFTTHPRHAPADQTCIVNVSTQSTHTLHVGTVQVFETLLKHMSAPSPAFSEATTTIGAEAAAAAGVSQRGSVALQAAVVMKIIERADLNSELDSLPGKLDAGITLPDDADAEPQL